jgi:DNA helicase-2/ATP-dependent DNA helicase PcrA
MEYLKQLNPQQREAALCTEGPLLILAGAGSGKTSTMTHRIGYLIREKGVLPGEIFAVTFTNKAAREMRDRVEGLVGSTRGMWILTFHSACLRILRYEAQHIGYNPNFTVYDPQDQKMVIKACLKEKNLEDKRFSPAYVLSVISKCKEKDQSPEDYRKEEGGDFLANILGDLYEMYERVLKQNNAMDFDDLLRNTVHLFERNPQILTQYQKRFSYIMVDEYQDTNYIQYRIIQMLAARHGNICVVGDDDQCIYQWRGADIRNILHFEKDFKGTKVVKLEENYRSHGNILAGAHDVISHNLERKDKKLWTQKEPGEKIKYHRADSEKDEARYVASEISRLNKQKGERKNFDYRDFVVLYRTNAQSRSLEEALIHRDIPYRVLGNLRYYDRKEIKDMLAYMRLVVNPGDDLALERIINEPKRGVGAKSLEKLRAYARAENCSILSLLQESSVQSMLPGKAGMEVGILGEILGNLWKEQANLRISDIYDQLLVRTGYLENLEAQNTIETEGRIENLMEFKSVIIEWEKEALGNEDMEGTLASFLEKISLMAEVDNYNTQENAVTLMTLHSAKGLEFPVVFMVGMEDGLFPGWRSMEQPEKLEEERRLCYVGMTRAMKRLYLLSAEVRTLYGKTDYTRESMFLREIDKRRLEGDGMVHHGRPRDRGLGEDGYSKPVVKPFDGLKYATSQSKKAVARDPSLRLQVGDLVEHAKFGPGRVVDSAGATVTVIFDGEGTKKLAVDLAPLKKR